MIRFDDYKVMYIDEIAHVERARKNKVYPEGCTLIALSATKGQAELTREPGTVGARYAVVIPKEGVLPKYLFYSIQQALPRFIHEWAAGINLQMDKLQYLQVGIHPVEVQEEVVNMFETVEEKQNKEEEALRYWRDAKKRFLVDMFI